MDAKVLDILENCFEWNRDRKLIRKIRKELEALTHDGNFMRKMENVYSTFKAYLDVEPDHSRPSVAYFSMNMVWTGFLKSIPAVWAYWQVTI